MTPTRARGLRVLYVLRYFPTLTETFVYREIRGLRDRGVATIAGFDALHGVRDRTVVGEGQRPQTCSRPPTLC